MRAAELDSAERHIAQLEEQILALKDAQRARKKVQAAKPGSFWRRVQGKLRGSTAGPKPEVSQSARDYQQWFARHRASADQLVAMREELRTFKTLPLVSILTPVFNTPVDWLAETVQSVRAQIYGNWELILIDDASTNLQTLQALRSLARGDQRIRLVLSDDHGGIAAASNRGLSEARGDWVAILDHDDLLEPDALFYAAKILQEHPDADLVYSDEDKIGEHGLEAPFFKPDWSPDFFLSYNYVCHFTIVRRALVEDVGRFRLGFDGAQDYDLFLRVIERTNRIHHLARVLYHWRRTATSTSHNIRRKPGALEAGKRALSDHLERCGQSGHIAIDWRTHAYRVRRDLNRPAKICIIVRGNREESVKSVERLSRMTNYPNCQFIVTESSSATAVDKAVAQTNSPWLLFLQDDAEPINCDWLELMAEHLQRPEVGAVGARLLRRDATIEHAGVVLSFGQIAQNAFSGFPAEHPGVCRQLQITRNYSAVSGACLLTRRDLFDQVGGFDEVVTPFSDADFCLKLRRAGYLVVYTPFAKLYCDDRQRNTGLEQTAAGTMRARWPTWLQRDPYYNANLSSKGADFSLGCESS